MLQQSRKVAEALLLGFAAANLLVLACAVAAPPMIAETMAESMTDCGMAMPADDAEGDSPGHDCCMSCITEAALLGTHGVWVPSVAAVALPPAEGVQDFPTPLVRPLSDDPVPPDVSPPVFLLNGSLLI